MIKVGIVGISGYSGKIALQLLLKHPHVRVTYVSADSTTGKVGEIWPDLSGQTDLFCEKFDLNKARSASELLFLSTPHNISMRTTPHLLKSGCRVIDLSGDYRFKSARLYKKWYGTEHADTPNLAKAVYGLPEIYREQIKKARLVANPGCYPTAAILGLAPFLAIYGKALESIIIDAKSGVSGAGRKAKLELLFCEVNENFKAYKVLNHQHAPEIDLYLSKISPKPVRVNFVPHLLPINRGILETIYVQTKERISLNELHRIYQRFFKTEPFVRIVPLGQQPELKNVVGTNYCDIGIAINAQRNLFAITSVIDNLVKGAAGQAIQNMNIMCGFREIEALS